MGQRTAQRLAFHILRLSKEDALALADAIREVKETVGDARPASTSRSARSASVCEDPRRDPALSASSRSRATHPDERTHEFRGRYHVLGGAPLADRRVDPEDLHIAELFAGSTAASVREVVVATNSTTTGEATALYLADTLASAPDVAGHPPGAGLPVGGDLEYADEVTLGRAARALAPLAPRPPRWRRPGVAQRHERGGERYHPDRPASGRGTPPAARAARHGIQLRRRGRASEWSAAARRASAPDRPRPAGVREAAIACFSARRRRGVDPPSGPLELVGAPDGAAPRAEQPSSESARGTSRPPPYPIVIPRCP